MVSESINASDGNPVKNYCHLYLHHFHLIFCREVPHSDTLNAAANCWHVRILLAPRDTFRKHAL